MIRMSHEKRSWMLVRFQGRVWPMTYSLIKTYIKVYQYPSSILDLKTEFVKVSLHSSNLESFFRKFLEIVVSSLQLFYQLRQLG